MPLSQLRPYQVKGLQEAYDDLEKLRKNTRGIKIAAWVTAIATAFLAITAIATLAFQFLK